MRRVMWNLVWIVAFVVAGGSLALAGDPVPGAMEQIKPYPGLADAVTDMVFNNPNGRIHGHDAERIDVTVDDKKGIAEIQFIMPKNFTLHGDRWLKCRREEQKWTCSETQ